MCRRNIGLVVFTFVLAAFTSEVVLAADIGGSMTWPEKGLELQCRQPEPAWLDCDYRFVRAEAVTGVSVRLGSQDIQAPKIIPYPHKGAATAVMFLVDTSDPRRQPVIGQIKEQITRLLKAGEAHHQFGLATFNSDMRIEAAVGSTRDEILQRLGTLKAQGRTTELYRNTLLAVRQLALQPVDRRAIFLFSDGLAEDRAYYHQDVVQAARQAGVIIYGIGYPQSTALSVALQTIRRLSEETGGLFVVADVSGNMPEAFLSQSFRHLGNGGRLEIDLSSVTGSGLGGMQSVVVSFETGGGVLSETVGVKFPIPESHSPQKSSSPPQEDTEAAVAEEHLQSSAPPVSKLQQPMVTTMEEQADVNPPDVQPRPKSDTFPVSERRLVLSSADYVLIGGGGVLMSLGLLLLWQRHQQRKKTTPKAVKSVEGASLGYLKFRDEPEREPVSITTPSMRIGRHKDNELRLEDPSISRYHAEVHRRRDGAFSINDLDSLNGIYVNDKQVKSSVLAEGDSVEVGDVRLSFTFSPGDVDDEEYEEYGEDEEETMILDQTIVSHTRNSFMGGGSG